MISRWVLPPPISSTNRTFNKKKKVGPFSGQASNNEFLRDVFFYIIKKKMKKVRKKESGGLTT